MSSIEDDIRKLIERTKDPFDLNNRDIGKLFKFLREKNRLTLRDVAKATGLSNSFICQFENGSEISLNRFIKLAEFYGLKIRAEQKE